MRKEDEAEWERSERIKDKDEKGRRKPSKTRGEHIKRRHRGNGTLEARPGYGNQTDIRPGKLEVEERGEEEKITSSISMLSECPAI
eukprot:755855-Hanusia_phi.AAC.4